MAGTEEVTDSLAASHSENVDAEEKETVTEKTEKIIRLPMTRIKSLIKMDPEVAIASADAAVLIAKATVRIYQSFFRFRLLQAVSV